MKSQFRDLLIAVKKVISFAALEPWSIDIDLQRKEDGSIFLNGAAHGNETEDEVTHEDFYLHPDAAHHRFTKATRYRFSGLLACR